MRTRSLAALATSTTIAALMLGTATAAAAGWAKISTDDTSSLWNASLALSGANVVAAMARSNGPGTANVEVDTFAPNPDASKLGTSVQRTNIVSGWQSLVNPWVIGSTGAGGLQAVIGGQATNDNSNPLNGTVIAQRNGDGSWAAPTPTGLANGATSGALGTAVAGPDGQTPIFVINYGADVKIFVGASGHTSSDGVDLASSQLGGSVETDSPKLAKDGQGNVWLAWFNSRSPGGVYVVQIDPATGNPMGQAVLAPSSNTGANFGPGNWTITCAAACRVVYHLGDADQNDTGHLGSWWIGEPAATQITGPATPISHFIAAAERPDGRLWVLWLTGDRFKATLGDAHGAGGTTQDLGVPIAGGDPFQVRAIAAPDGSVVAVTDTATPSGAPFSFWADDTPAPGTYTGPTKQTSTTVGDTVLTLVSPKSCVPAGSKIIAKLFVAASKTKHKAVGKGRLKVKVKTVTFLVDGKPKVIDKKKPFQATLVLAGLQPGSSHELRAKVRLKVRHGPPRSRSIRAKFQICG